MKIDKRLLRSLKSPYWRLNNLYWIIDEGGNRVKFKLERRPALAQFWNELWWYNIILKSRQHGFTTEIDLIGLDYVLFNPNIRAGIIAHTREAVSAIFRDKIKYPYENLPEAIRAILPAIKDDAGELLLANNSSMRVATSMRSATLNWLHVSEHGKICAKYPQKAVELKTGTLPTLHEGAYCFIESTAEGAAGDFYDFCQQSRADTIKGNLAKQQFKFHFAPWYKNPEYSMCAGNIVISADLQRYFDELESSIGVFLTSEQRSWYAFKKEGSGGLGKYMKREHPSTPEEAFEQSVEGAIFGEELESARSEGRVGSGRIDDTVPVYTFWDLGIGDKCAIWWVQFIGNDMRPQIIDYHAEAGRGMTYHCKLVGDKKYYYGGHYFPHDVMNREKGTGVVLLDLAQSLLREPVYKVVRPHLKADSIQAARDLFPYCNFLIPACNDGLKALGFYRYEWDDERACYSDLPVHDWSSDGADAFQTMALAKKKGISGMSNLQPVSSKAKMDELNNKYLWPVYT